MSRSSPRSSSAASRTRTQAEPASCGGTQNFSGSAAISSVRSCRGQRTAKDVSSSGTVTNIFPATRKVGMLHASFSTVSGRDSAIRRTSSASITVTVTTVAKNPFRLARFAIPSGTGGRRPGAAGERRAPEGHGTGAAAARARGGPEEPRTAVAGAAGTGAAYREWPPGLMITSRTSRTAEKAA